MKHHADINSRVLDVNDCIVSIDDTQDYTQEKLLLVGLLKFLKLSYTNTDIEEILENYDKKQFVAFLLGANIYEYTRANSNKKRKFNDIIDIQHLLYLKDENYIIVSNDKIFDDISLNKMRIKTAEFLEDYENLDCLKK